MLPDTFIGVLGINFACLAARSVESSCTVRRVQSPQFDNAPCRHKCCHLRPPLFRADVALTSARQSCAGRFKNMCCGRGTSSTRTVVLSVFPSWEGSMQRGWLAFCVLCKDMDEMSALNEQTGKLQRQKSLRNQCTSRTFTCHGHTSHRIERRFTVESALETLTILEQRQRSIAGLPRSVSSKALDDSPVLLSMLCT